jgi:very-short-patch-repair endonuclease
MRYGLEEWLARGTEKAVKPPKAPRKLSLGEETLAQCLTAKGIKFEREVLLTEGRMFKLDFVLRNKLAVEIDGGNFNGGHSRGKAYEQFCRKINLANSLGWTVYRFTVAMVVSGEAINTILAALGMETK